MHGTIDHRPMCEALEAETAFNGYVEYSRKKYRLIPKDKVWINSRTPVGEPAEYWEKKPHDGRREFYPLLERSSPASSPTAIAASITGSSSGGSSQFQPNYRPS